jgi:hypothetical protein
VSRADARLEAGFTVSPVKDENSKETEPEQVPFKTSLSRAVRLLLPAVEAAQ